MCTGTRACTSSTYKAGLGVGRHQSMQCSSTPSPTCRAGAGEDALCLSGRGLADMTQGRQTLLSMTAATDLARCFGMH
eukprot:scaffold87969_cov31-Tisochrysis_lutea.AAC.6